MKKVIVSVTNDLYSDQRVDKVCNSLINMGFDVLLVGRRYRNSPALAPRAYQTHRLHLMFRKGAKFYAEYNVRLFFYLLFKKCNILISNDLDTLLPNFIISKIRKKRLVYDSHEYFCGVPELIGRPFVQNVWRKIERFCFPRLKDVITVNQSIADLYDREYPNRKNRVNVVRNIPTRPKPPITETRDTLGLPDDKAILILQGSGINVDRGAEELVAAMQFVDNALLLLVGSGDAVPNLKMQVEKQNLNDKVRFISRVPFAKLFNYTYLADIGFSLDKDTNINYRFSLPNKIFDYIKAETPVIVSDLPEIAKVVREAQVGIVIADHQPETIAQAIQTLLSDHTLYAQLKENTLKAANHYCWENEEAVLRKIYLE
ncbi:MAG: glycosyltransferase [Bacteroidales bacterium]|nr:glycosyltransferase [Bacteroidales bacterium]MDD4394656.1 glycosyltransferase [Bacteroidales bacterium]